MRNKLASMLRRRALAGTIFTVVLLAAPSGAQYIQQLPNQPAPSTHPVVPGGASQSGNNPNNDDDPMARRMALAIAKNRNVLRQKQIASDTSKLLELATEIQDEVDKSNKDTLSVAALKKAEEIEKLAKAVRDRMRDGQ
jgi:hypothetical protein